MRPTASGLLLASLLLLPAVGSLQAAEDPSNTYSFAQDGRRLDVIISPQYTPAMRDNLLQWIDYIAAALRQVYGHWPTQHWQMVLVPSAAAANDPIPWAQVTRGEINRVEFFTSASASADELKRAWTSYHELAHLLIPYRGWGDAWFSEGLASYYQNILQARLGLISEQEMWQKLYNGFQRGLADTRFADQPLRLVSAKMRENGAVMRVYWSGAWYFLAADTQLRLQSGGRLNLDLALANLNNCCAEERLSVSKIVARLDRLNRVLLFRRLYDEVAESHAVPPFDAIYASMGIDIVKGEVRLQQIGPGARLRREIVSKRGL